MQGQPTSGSLSPCEPRYNHKVKQNYSFHALFPSQLYSFLFYVPISRKTALILALDLEIARYIFY